jgi:hypothetical protein
MTLKLIYDESNVEKLDIFNFQDIPGCARRFAQKLETEDDGPKPSRVVAILDTPEGIAICVWGDAATGYELVGLLEAAKLHAYETNLTDDGGD